MQSRLMDYLYGELNDKEKQEMEAWLAANPAVARELEELHGVRRQLRAAAPVAPVVRLVAPARTLGGWWRGAAAAVLLALGLWALNFQADYNDGRLSLHFGTPPAAAPSPIAAVPRSAPTTASGQEDDAVWQAALLARYDSLERQLARRDAAWERHLASLNTQTVALPPDSVFVRQWQQQILPELTAFAHQLRLQQREEMHDLLQEAWADWAQVRERDLYRIDQVLLELQQRHAYSLQEHSATAR